MEREAYVQKQQELHLDSQRIGAEFIRFTGSEPQWNIPYREAEIAQTYLQLVRLKNRRARRKMVAFLLVLIFLLSLSLFAKYGG